MARHNQQRINPSSEEGRRQAALEEVRRTLEPEEAERIRAAREFDNVKPGTLTWEVAVFNDQLRKIAREQKRITMRRVNNVHKIKNVLTRLEKQLESGVITEKADDNVTMTVSEVEWYRDEQTQTLLAEVSAIPPELAKLRAVVGHLTVDRKVAMTEEEFEAFVLDVKNKVKELGYDLFAS